MNGAFWLLVILIETFIVWGTVVCFPLFVTIVTIILFIVFDIAMGAED